MGCLIFIVSIICSYFLYAVIGGIVGSFIMHSKGIVGADTNFVAMPIFLIIAPILALITATVLSMLYEARKNKDGNEL